MQLLTIRPRFYPIRLQAYVRNEVELTVQLENLTDETFWGECVVECPEALSLAPDKPLGRGKLRVGILGPKETASARCKIYASARSYPDVYTVRLTGYAFGKDGAIIGREDSKTELRCEAFTAPKE